MAEGNREEEDRLGTAPLPSRAFSHAQPLDPRVYSPRQHYNYQSDDVFLPPTASFDPQATIQPGTIASYAAANFQAVAANAAAVVSIDPYPFANSTDPDDFYRDYRATQTSTSPPRTATATATLQPSLMASTALPHPHPHPPSHPHTRQAITPIRLDNHGNLPITNTTKIPNPALPVGQTTLRPVLRSVSTPVDDRASGQASAGSGYGPTKQPSVKDLKKRFDQTAATSSTSTQPGVAVRKLGTRNPTTTKDGLSSNVHNRTAGSASGQAASASATSYTALRSSTSRDAGADSSRSGPASSRTTHRQRFAEEDQLSNNSQSFASRVRSPRTGNQSMSSKGQVSKPASHPPDMSPPLPQSPPQPSPAAPALSPGGTRPNGLLFGEILAQDNNSRTAGFGIDGVRPRRTSESHLPSPTAFDRSHLASAGDDSPSSPTDWYRGVASPSRDGRPPAAKASRIPQSTYSANHGRAHSDTAPSIPSKPPLSIRRPISRQNGPNGSNGPNSPSSLSSQPSSPSRLPMSVKQLSRESDPSSPSSRSNSPSSVQYLPASGRSSRQHNPPTAKRAKTPTVPSTTARAKTPTRDRGTASTRKAAPSKITTTPGNNGSSANSGTRLAAYISAPPPKLSPPLRSSRPRQPVSTASTASSRLKAVDRAQANNNSTSASSNSNSNSGNKLGTKDDESSNRRRRISVGPIDFAQRRETIKLAYSKSIRESQAREARQAAAQRRKRELEAAAKAKAEAEAAAAAAAAGPAESDEKPAEDVGDAGVGTASSSHLEKDVVEPALTITTGAPPPPAETATKPSSDSPTLGIPGSFPSFGSSHAEVDEEPLSAVSNASVVTEFDVEEQTEPPVPVPESNGLGIANSVSPVPPVVPHEKATYRSPFDELATVEEDKVSIKISLEASSPPPTAEQPTPTIPDYHDSGPRVPGSFHDDLDGAQVDFPVQTLQQAVYQGEPAKTQSLAKKPPTPHSHGREHEQEYEARPFLPLSQPTTVTILSRDSDFRPVDHPPPKPPKLPKSPSLAEHHLRRSVEHIHGLHDQDSRPPEPHMDSLEDFYVGPHVGDNISILRDSPGLSSDFSDDQSSFAEAQRAHLEAGHNLTVPGLLSPANRSSQLSTWTDFSLDSSDGGRDRNSKHSVVISRDSTVRGRPPMLAAASRPESLADECSSSREDDDMQYSPQHGRSEEHLGMSAYSDSQRLLEVDTGAGFSVDYLPVGSPAVPVRPDHEPPPVPMSDTRSLHDGRRTPSSGYYDQTRPNSYFQSNKDDQNSFSLGTSRRESDDFTQSIMTPKSTDQGSLDSTGVAFSRASTLDIDQKTSASDEVKDQAGSDKQTPAGREKSRLTQRQNVIKELIDTEGSFVRDMSVVEEIYKGTAEACPKLDGKTIKLIFRNTDEIIIFHTTFLNELKDSVSVVYTPKGRRSPFGKDGNREESMVSDTMTVHSSASSSTKDVSREPTGEPDDAKDRLTSIGPVFVKHIEQMRQAHEGFLRTSDHAAKRLIQIQEDKTVKVWLDECNEVAKDLTAAWNLDSLLIKPMQRITKYPNLISQLLQYTPEDHPDREPLISARTALENAILDINRTKKNFELVGQIVGRKRKESDVRAGFARAFGKRVDKLQASANRPPEDPEYQRLNEKFGDDYLRLQVVLRDVEFYTRQVSAYVHEFLQYLSAMELVMRLQPSPFPEIESKWARFNVSMRDMEKVALDQHLAQVRKHVIEPFELVIKCYSNPSLAMKKRAKRRLDYERAEQLKKGGKKVDKQLGELVEHYEALNETLKKELPKLSAHTESIGNICLGNFVCIQVKWFSIWKEKVKVVLEDAHVPEFAEVVSVFQREFREMEDQIGSIGILNPTMKPRSSQSTADESSMSISSTRTRSRPAELSPRSRGLSLNSDQAPSLPTPEFVRTNSGHFTLSPTVTTAAAAAGSSPHHYYYRDQYSGLNNLTSSNNNRPAGSGSPGAPNHSTARPSTGRSYDSSAPTSHRPSVDSAGPGQAGKSHHRQDSASTYNSSFPAQQSDNRRFSGLFHSALPVSDELEEQRQSNHHNHHNHHQNPNHNISQAQYDAQVQSQLQGLLQSGNFGGGGGQGQGQSRSRSHSQSQSHSQRPSRASSRERLGGVGMPATNGYNVLWLAASLFEFNIEDTKHEAGYPYLTYQAGEIFDVIAEKGELWLAKNQDDPSSLVGWIWSKHFAKLADS